MVTQRLWRERGVNKATDSNDVFGYFHHQMAPLSYYCDKTADGSGWLAIVESKAYKGQLERKIVVLC